jgi:hypothetical protein
MKKLHIRFSQMFKRAKKSSFDVNDDDGGGDYVL